MPIGTEPLYSATNMEFNYQDPTVSYGRRQQSRGQELQNEATQLDRQEEEELQKTYMGSINPATKKLDPVVFSQNVQKNPNLRYAIKAKVESEMTPGILEAKRNDAWVAAKGDMGQYFKNLDSVQRGLGQKEATEFAKSISEFKDVENTLLERSAKLWEKDPSPSTFENIKNIMRVFNHDDLLPQSSEGMNEAVQGWKSKLTEEQQLAIRKQDEVERAAKVDESINWYKAKNPSSASAASQPTDSELEGFADDLAKGRLSPTGLKDIFPAGRTGGTAREKTLTRAREIFNAEHPGEDFNISRLNRDYNNFKSANTTKALMAVETFIPNLDRLQTAISGLPTNAPLRSLNKMLQSGQIEFGGVAATNVDMLEGVLAHELGSSLGGGTALSDERIRIAMKALNAKAPKEAALKALDMLRAIEVNRHVNVAMSGGVYGEDYLRGIYGDEIANKLIEEERAARKKVGKKAVKQNEGGAVETPAISALKEKAKSGDAKAQTFLKSQGISW